MKIIYLASFKANHPGYDIVYQDINGQRDIGGDMLDIDLSPYDVIIATPPCNYYSKANIASYKGTLKPDSYSMLTKHLLPGILNKLSKIDKPFIIENVRSSKIDKIIEKTPPNVHVYQHGRHTYWTNFPFNPKGIKQKFDFEYGGRPVRDLSKNQRQGGKNVHDVIEYWLKVVLI